MPPASGRMAPSSAYVSAPKKDRIPPAIHTPSAPSGLVPVLARTSPGTRKMPEPMTMPTAVNARSAVPRTRASGVRSAADEGGLVTGGNMARGGVYRNGTVVYHDGTVV